MKYKLPEGWREVKLGDVIDKQIDNRGRNPSEYLNYSEHPVIDNYLIKNERYPDLEEVKRYVSKDTFENFLRGHVEKDDVIITLVGNGIGNLSMIPNNKCTIIQNTLGLRCNNLMDNSFLFYTLLYNQSEIVNFDRGSSQPSIRKTDLFRQRINSPPLKEQKAIANTLLSLDDKIENNNKIVKNLEAQAQAIFKHWFVDFEFPNEEGKPYKSSGGEMVESELGMIPKGWEIGMLGDSKLGKLITSGIDNFRGEKIYLATADVTGTDITNNDIVVTMDSRPSRANMQPKSNTVWFAKMKDSRKLIFVEKKDNILKDKYIFSTGFAGIQGSETSIYYLWTYIQSDNFDSIKNNLCTGTTMQAINNRNINRIKLVIPDSKILEEFNLIVKPLYKKIIVSRNENQRLEELRDTLLPKLISGELRIPLD